MHVRGQRTLLLLLAGMLSAILALGVVVVPGAVPAEARTLQDLEDQRERNRKEREEVKAALEGTDQELSELYLQLDQTRRELSEARTELAVRQEELAAAERELQSVRDRLEVAQAQKEELAEAMAENAEEMERTSSAIGDVARSAYRGSGNISALAVVMNAGSLQEFADSYSAMNNALRNQGLALGDLREGNVVNENQQARLDGVEERIAELKAEAEELVAIAEEKRAAAAALVENVAALEAQQESQAAEFEQFIAEGEKRLEKLKTDDSKLAKDIAAIHEAERKRREAEERRQREAAERARQAQAERERKAAAAAAAAKPNRPSSGSSSSASRPAAPSKPRASSPKSSSSSSGRTGALIPPISRSLYVTSPWGYRWYPISGGWYMHNGVDLRSGCGERQFASAGGTVTAVRGAYGNGTHGNQVMINHGSIGGATYVTVYNHLSGFAVSQGQRVSQGQTIGYTGATGMVTGCHVHFEVWRNGNHIDPMTLPAFR